MSNEIYITDVDDLSMQDAQSEEEPCELTHQEVIVDIRSETKNTTTRNAVAYVGFCFFVFFSGHSIFRSLLPAWKPQSGPLLVALSFFAYALGSLVPPKITKNHKRLFFTLGALAQAQWIGILQLPSDNVAFSAVTAISSFLNGLGAGILWSTQGQWMNLFCSEKNPHAAQYYTGMFLFFYGSSGFLGNVAALLTLVFIPHAISLIVWCLFGVACFGSLLLFLTPQKFLHPANRVVDQAEYAVNLASSSIASSKRFHQTSSQISSTNRLKTIKTLFLETFFPKTIAAIMALAIVSAFAWVVIPKLCASAFDALLSDKLPVYTVPMLFALYSLANAIGAPLSSMLIKRHNVKVAYGFFTVIAMLVCLFFIIDTTQGQLAIYGYAIATFAFGLVVGAYNNCLYALLASKLTLELAAKTSLSVENHANLIGEAYCWHGFIYCISYTIFSSLVTIICHRWLAVITFVMVIVGLLNFFAIKH